MSHPIPVPSSLPPRLRSSLSRFLPLILAAGSWAPLRAADTAEDIPRGYAGVSVARGLVALSRNQPELAERSFREALEIDPDRQDAHLNLGLALLARNRKDEARHVLEAAYERFPENDELGVVLGRSYLALDENERVIAVLSPVAKRRPDLPDLGYYLGHAQLQTGRSQDALKSFRRGPWSSRELEERARFYEGTALARLGRTRAAGEVFTGLARESVYPTLAQIAGKFEIQLREAAGRGRTRGSVKVAQQFDDNAVVAPTTNVFNLQNQPTESFGALLNGHVAHDLIRRDDRATTLSYTLTKTWNYDIPEVNLDNHTFGIASVWSGAWRNRIWRAGVQSAFDRLLIDERGFLERRSASPFVSLQHDPDRSTTLLTQYQKKNFLNQGAREGSVEDRDAENYMYGLIYSHLLPKWSWNTFIGVQRDHEAARGSNIDYQGTRFLVGASGPIKRVRLDLNLLAQFHGRDYRSVHSLFGLTREDDESTYFMSLSRALSPSRTLALEVLHDRNRSLIPLFDFRRTTTSLSMLWRW